MCLHRQAQNTLQPPGIMAIVVKQKTAGLPNKAIVFRFSNTDILFFIPHPPFSLS
jgi:hypothetical protein